MTADGAYVFNRSLDTLVIFFEGETHVLEEAESIVLFVGAYPTVLGLGNVDTPYLNVLLDPDANGPIDFKLDLNQGK
jgi:hypothetical protein